MDHKALTNMTKKNNIPTLSAKLEQEQNPTKDSENLKKIKGDFVDFLKKIKSSSLITNEKVNVIKDMSQKIVEAIEGAKESIGTKEDELCEAMGKMTIKDPNKNA